MPDNDSWIHAGDYSRDDMCSQGWSMYIQRDENDEYEVLVEGDESSTVSVGDVTGLIGFFEDYGDVALSRLRSALDGLDGTEAAQDMIRIRLSHFSSGT
jgi:hypothetical protein